MLTRLQSYANALLKAFKVSIWPTGFVIFGISLMCKKGTGTKKNRIPASATPTQIDGGTEQKRDWVPEQVVTSSQEAPNPESC